MRYVGDVDLQLEVAVRHAAHGDRVVEVARGFAVDGDDGQRAIVAAMTQLAGRNDRLKLLRLLQDLDREAMRQMELADDDLDIDAEVVFVAEDFDHAPARIFGRRRPVGDLDLDDHVLQVAPLAAAGLVAEHAIADAGPASWREGALSLAVPLSSGRAAVNAAPAPFGGLPEWSVRCSSPGHSMPRGMMISCVTFSSMGVT